MKTVIDRIMEALEHKMCDRSGYYTTEDEIEVRQILEEELKPSKSVDDLIEKREGTNSIGDNKIVVLLIEEFLQDLKKLK